MSLWFKSPIKSEQVPDVGYDMSEFEVGDRLRTRHTYWHEGIYVGPRGPNGESVVHNDFDAKQAIISHPEGFTRKGRPIYLAKRTPAERREEVAERAMQMLGTKFDIVRFNCQHFASYVQDGEPVSPRVRSAALSIGVLPIIGSVLTLIVVPRK